jgi:uncharacterized protein (TIGR02246 family)
VGEDEDGIRRTISEYSQRCDDGRFDVWSELFTEDGRFVVAGNATVGREPIRKMMEAMLPPGSRGKHITSNTIVDIDGHRAASSTDYLFVRPTPTGPTIVAAGRYHDRLVREGTHWRFEERTITMLGDSDGTADG